MNPRIPDIPPQILPLREDAVRPLFSVMIPAYNCIDYLKEAMESVMAQDLGAELMQIKVVDDCSIDGDVGALVREVGKGRIGYYRQVENVGSLRNFETCINQARGRFIHLLHGDDKVQRGFYQEIRLLFERHPEAGAAFTGCSLVDVNGQDLFTCKPVSRHPGILQNWLTKIALYNRIQPSAIVVKRSVYEELGSFFAIHYGEDWEMWVRIASSFPVAYSPKCLASYRVHTNNITSRSFLTGQNIKDFNTLLPIIESYLPESNRNAVIKRTKKYGSRYMAVIAQTILFTYKDPKAAILQANSAIKMYKDPVTFYRVIIFYLKYLFFTLRSDSSLQEKTEAFRSGPAINQG